MGNVIIVLIIIVAAGIGVWQTVKHMQGKSACCDTGSDTKAVKKKLSKVLYKRTFQVEGMHCNNCKNRVENAVNSIPGVSGKVNLQKGTVEVSYEQEVDNSIIIREIEKNGYFVLE